MSENSANEWSALNQAVANHTSDAETTVASLRNVVAAFVRERNWEQFHNPKNLSMSLAIEAAELMEHFQWRGLDEAQRIVHQPEERAKIAEEVADCLAYLLALANVMQLDLSTTLIAKMHKNAQKYPIELAAGKWEKPTS